MERHEMAAWKCPSGHVMGFVRRNGSGVRQLLLLRQALATDDSEVDVMGVVEGYVADVTCSVCAGMRTWVPGAEALGRLLRQYQKRG